MPPEIRNDFQDSTPCPAEQKHGLMRIAFGPVPSRRLGRSLGINNIPAKYCTYSCGYCQVGKTLNHSIVRQEFFPPQLLVEEVGKKVVKAQERGEPIDFLTFVPYGEPTLDIHLGKEIECLKSLGVRIAVITNSSLLWRRDVQDDLVGADLVSIKADTVVEREWHKLNRPHVELTLPLVMRGLREFAHRFDGELLSETMLISGVNDDAHSLDKLSDFLVEIGPRIAYLATPTRPPAENWVCPVSKPQFQIAVQILSSKLDFVETLSGYEGNSFVSIGDTANDLKAICAVHPMREDAVKRLLRKTGTDWSLVQKLISEGELVEKHFQGVRFYVSSLEGSVAKRNRFSSD